MRDARYGVRLRYMDGTFSYESLGARYYVVDLKTRATIAAGPFETQHDAEEQAARMNLELLRENMGS